jgi:hypothetical protein
LFPKLASYKMGKLITVRRMSLLKVTVPHPTGSFGLNRNTSVGNPTPLSIFMFSFCRQAQCTRRLRGRALAQSACPSAQNSPRSYVPQAPGRKARETHTMQDEGYAPFQDPFLTLYFVQFASFAHFFCCIVLPYAPSTSMQVSVTYGQRLLFSIFAQPKRTCTAVQAVNDSRGNTSVSPDLRTCCACRAYQHACDGLAFKFTEQMVDSELPSPNPRRSELSTILD